MATRAEPRNWYDKFAFVIKVDGFIRAAFQKCSELAANVEVIEYREGGQLYPDKSAGLVSFENITLERGESVDTDMYDWYVQHYNASTGTGSAKKSDYARDLVIEQRDRSGAVVRTWNVFQAVIEVFSTGDWDNDANEKKIERIELGHHGFELAPVTGGSISV